MTKLMRILVVVSLFVFVFSTLACTVEEVVVKEVNVINAPVATDTRPLCSNLPEATRESARSTGVCKD